MILLAAFVLLIVESMAQSTTADPKNDYTSDGSISRISLETDPTTFFFNGYSLAIRRSATGGKRLDVGAGLYRTELPDFYIEAAEENQDKGWSARNFGVDGFVDYHFFDANRGLTAGLVLSVYQFTLQRNQKETSYNALIETLRVGYMWRPIKKWDALYIFPWVGLSTGQKIGGSNQIEGETFHTPQWSVVPAFQLGYSF